jgi:hypothetical protein
MKLFALSVFFTSALGFSQCFNSGDGSDGAFHATIDTTIVGGVYNHTSFIVDAGVTVTVSGTTPLTIYCNGTMTINGTLTVSGADGSPGITFASAGIGAIGVAGGGNGGDGSYAPSTGPLPGTGGTGPGAGNLGTGWSGGGGAGYVANGDNAIGGALGGSAYGDAAISGLEAGSGGGGGSGGFECGSGGGGAGGGLIHIFADVLVISATGVISSDGGNGGSDGTGNCGGGGGGSGGSIYILSPNATNNGSISAVGGLGGSSTYSDGPGANAANGRIRIDGTYSGSGSVTPAIGFSTSLISNAYNTQDVEICEGESIVVNTNTYSVAGTYNDTVVGGAANGCDSVIVTNLSIHTLDLGVTVGGASLTANLAGETYQWIDCSDSSVIAGETSQTFTPSVSGSYAVILTDALCSDTSACETFITGGLESSGDAQFNLYPNPTRGIVTILFGKMTDVELIAISDISGRVIYRLPSVSGELLQLDLSGFENGNYFVSVVVGGKTHTEKFVKF